MIIRTFNKHSYDLYSVYMCIYNAHVVIRKNIICDKNGVMMMWGVWILAKFTNVIIERPHNYLHQLQFQSIELQQQSIYISASIAVSIN